MDEHQLMRHAIRAARTGIAAGQSPFGCAVARGDQLLVATHNTVRADTDITAHAEINAVRRACREVDAIFLDECTVATTCEPCPMCLTALHWSRAGQVYYGATIEDAAQAGFNELQVGAAQLLVQGGSRLKLSPGVLVAECRSLFEEWLNSPEADAY